MKRFFLLQSAGHFYCLPAEDLLVAHPPAVGEVLNFKYNAKSYSGELLKMSDNENKILDEIKALKVIRKERKDKSFHADQPREASKKQRVMMTNIVKATQRKRSKEPNVLGENGRGDKGDDITEVAVLKDGDKPKEKSSPAQKEVTVDDTDDSNDDVRSSYKSDSSRSSIQVESLKDQVASKKEDLRKLRELDSAAGPSGQGKHKSDEKALRQKSILDMLPHVEKSPHGRDKSPPVGEKSPPVGEKSPVDDGEKSSDGEIKKRRSSLGKKSSNASKKKKSKKRNLSSSGDSDSSSQPETKKNKSRSKRRKVRRNMDIYPGQNFLHAAIGDGIVQLDSKFQVYVKDIDLMEAASSKTITQFVRQMVDKVYTKDAIENASPKGFPPRGKRKQSYSHSKVPPRMHPHGILAIVAKAKDLEATDNKHWAKPQKVNEQLLHSVFSCRCWELKTRYNAKVDPASDSSDNSSS